MLNPIFPKPSAFYQRPEFSGDRGYPISHNNVDLNNVSIYDADDRYTERLLSQIKLVNFRRFGALKGEYVIMGGSPGGLVLIDNNGTPIKINTDSDTDFAHHRTSQHIDDYCASEHFIMERDAALSQWRHLEVSSNMPILGESHSFNNYYHFLMLFLPKVRNFVDSESTIVGVLERNVSLPFQIDLIRKTFGSRRLKIIKPTTRVDNPIIVTEPFSADGLSWLKATIGITAKRGNKRIYISRASSSSGRKGGNVIEGDEFNSFLSENGFERINFGSGDIPVSNQIEMLDGAGVILSAHGANLTNIAFLQPGVKIIELIPHYWPYFSTLQIAAASALSYFGIVSHNIDDNLNIIPNIETINRVLSVVINDHG
jgi:hypothetical protein